MAELLQQMQNQNMQSAVHKDDGKLMSSADGSTSAAKLDVLVNTNIINDLPQKPKKLLAPKQRTDRNKSFPSFFSLRGKIGNVYNQQKCGSCWAVATATVFSDVVSINTGRRVEISPTDLLRCNTQGQNGCGGGQPALAIKHLKEKGIMSENCVDYSWCKQNEVCAGNPKEHFDNPTAYLNSKIPKCASCYTKGKKVRKYFAKNLYSIFAEKDQEVEDLQYDVKEHLMKVGPVMGAYFILSNFMVSNGFKETNGVYLEEFNYTSANGGTGDSNDGSISANKTPFKLTGGHAVVITGWGETNVSALNPKTGKPFGKVQYWEVRNSWGESWGDNGYFKMAMYPHNKFSQFDLAFNAGSINDPVWVGGFSLFEYDKVKMVDVDKEIEFKLDDNDTINVGPLKTEDETILPGQGFFGMSRKMKILLVVLVVLVILGYVYREKLKTMVGMN